MTERHINPRAEIARFSHLELMQYKESMDAYRDIVNAINTAKKDSYAEGREDGREEGREEGREQRNLELAKMMKEKGIVTKDICEMTGLSEEQVKLL